MTYKEEKELIASSGYIALVNLKYLGIEHLTKTS